MSTVKNMEETEGEDIKLDQLLLGWFRKDDLSSKVAATFEEDCALETERSNALDEQLSIAREILVTPATSLDHVLSKLILWDSAYGPPKEATLESGWDTYNLMVVSAMHDLRRFIEAISEIDT